MLFPLRRKLLFAEATRVPYGDCLGRLTSTSLLVCMHHKVFRPMSIRSIQVKTFHNGYNPLPAPCGVSMSYKPRSRASWLHPAHLSRSTILHTDRPGPSLSHSRSSLRQRLLSLAIIQVLLAI